MSSQVISRSVLFQPGPARSASYTSLSNLINRRREFCHLAGTPSPSLLRHLLKGEGVQQNRQVSPTASSNRSPIAMSAQGWSQREPSRRREFCHSAAPNSRFSGRFNSDREGVSAK